MLFGCIDIVSDGSVSVVHMIWSRRSMIVENADQLCDKMNQFMSCMLSLDMKRFVAGSYCFEGSL